MQNVRTGETARAADGGDARTIRRVPPSFDAWVKDATREIKATAEAACWCGLCHTSGGNVQKLPLRYSPLDSKINRAKRAKFEGSWRREMLEWQSFESLKKLLKG